MGERCVKNCSLFLRAAITAYRATTSATLIYDFLKHIWRDAETIASPGIETVPLWEGPDVLAYSTNVSISTFTLSQSSNISPAVRAPAYVPNELSFLMLCQKWKREMGISNKSAVRAISISGKAHAARQDIKWDLGEEEREKRTVINNVRIKGGGEGGREEY